MKTSLPILCFALMAISCRPQYNTVDAFKPTFTISEKTTHNISEKQAYVFGYLEVLENRDRPDGNTIKLPVYIFKSRSDNPKPDPVLYTVGGPGYTSMRASQYMNYYKYLDDRDLILFEQRGTQYARPSLDCPEWSEALYRSNFPDMEPSDRDALLEKAAKSCRERLVGNGIDLNSYNTNAIAADINDLMEVLDVGRYNLLTLSYSTKIAQVLMRDYPDNIRSVVMDSPLPLEVSYDEESAGNVMEALQLVLTDCEKDKNCSTAYPNIKQRFFEYLRDKSKNPLVVEVENPKSGKMETFNLKGEDLITVFTASSTDGVPFVPAEINKLLMGDLSSVKEQLSYLFEGPGKGIGIGMRLSVWCAEEAAFNDWERISEETNKYPEIKGLSPGTYDQRICDIWGVSKVPDRENEAIQSDIPVLLISGQYDELTPPRWAVGMQKNFTNSYHVVFQGWKHGPTTNWDNPCAMEVAHQFFNQPWVRPKLDCLDSIVAPKFKLK
ncbi:MAG: alpha/beta fold hydrolase [Allomuricauda sp.]